MQDEFKCAVITSKLQKFFIESWHRYYVIHSYNASASDLMHLQVLGDSNNGVKEYLSEILGIFLGADKCFKIKTICHVF